MHQKIITLVAAASLISGCSPSDREDQDTQKTQQQNTRSNQTTSGESNTTSDHNRSNDTPHSNQTDNPDQNRSDDTRDDHNTTHDNPSSDTNTSTPSDDGNTTHQQETNGTDEDNATIIVDNTPPRITLNGDPAITLDISQEYVEYGATAVDETDGNLTGKISISRYMIVSDEKNCTVITYHVQDSSQNKASATRKVYVVDRLKALDTTIYKTKWFDKAKTAWNQEHSDNPYPYDYYTYPFPEGGDRIAGTPPDAPFTPREWMAQAGVGMSKFLKYPFKDSQYQYNDAQIKAWKAKGFRNGRIHVPFSAMVDLDADATGATLKQSALKEIRAICRLFVDNDLPITLSFSTGGDRDDDSISQRANDMANDRKETFRRIISWWRQVAAYFKNESYLIAFENFVEYHGFDDVAIEKKDFKVELNNGETHYEGFENYRHWAITNWVRTPGYNNLNAEIAKVIRLTNPKRIVHYKPNGIGRLGLVNITPWRWGSEADYRGITNQRTPYWIISSGGSANLNRDYLKAIRTDDQAEKETLLASAAQGTWGPAIHYYNATKIPVWIALFGIKLDEEKVQSDLNGTDATTEELVSYIDWYQRHIQNDALDANGTTVKIPSGFQQWSWVWDFHAQQWFTGKLNDRWDHFEKVGETLSKWAKDFMDN